jgi:GTP pyrophosphokinase
VPADEIDRAPAAEPESALGRAARKILPFGAPIVEVVGYDDLLASLAKCCNPLPGEPIVGYVTRGRGVSVHAAHCPNVTSLLYDPDRQIRVAWSGKRGATGFPAELKILTEDRPGLLADLTQVIAEEKSNIRRIEAGSEAGRGGEVDVVVEIEDVKHLERILKRLRAVSGVRQVRREFQPAEAGESSPA